MKTKNLTIILTALLFCTSFVLAEDNVIISQVLYDPANSDVYGEAIELYNPTSNSIDISNYIVKSSSSEKDATLPPNSIIPAYSYFLITDINFNQYKDNQSWSSPDYQESLSLTNTNAGIALLYNNIVIDALGWGNVSNPELYEAIPAQHVNEGFALIRYNLEDTNNNLVDFDSSIPEFHNSSFSTQSVQEQHNSGKIDILLNLNNSSPYILSYQFSEDVLENEGYQILPEPSKNKSISLLVTACDQDTSNDLSESTSFFDSQKLTSVKSIINSTCSLFNFTLKLPYFLAPALYEMQINVKDNSNSTIQSTASFELLPLLSLELDASNLDFNENSNTIFGDLLLSTPNLPTIKNTGNTALNLGFSAENFISGNNTLPSTILKYSLGNVEDFANTMSNILTVQTANLLPSSAIELNFKINIPETAVKGEYKTHAIVAGVSQ